MPRLTVMMAAYRAQSTVEASAKSVLLSMPKDSELLIAVDGPDLATLEAVERIKDRRVRVINDDQNVGTAVRHQQMLRESDSEFVANNDADDPSFPWRFRLTMPILKADRADMVFGSAIWFGQGKVKISAPTTLKSEDVKAVLAFSDPLLHSSMAARRSCLMEIGSYRKIGYSEDWELWMRAAARGARLHKVAAPVVGYRLSAGQMTQNVKQYLSDGDRSVWKASQEELLAHWGVPAGRSDGERVKLTRTEFDRIVASANNRAYVSKRAAMVVDFIPEES